MPYPVAARGRGINTPGIDITSFTQSVGSELLTNGSFANWSADNPSNWTVVGESGSDPMVNEVGAGEGHGGAGTGKCNLYSSASNNLPAITQNVLVANSTYEFEINVDTVAAGSVTVVDTGGGFASSTSSTGRRKGIGRALNVGFRVRGGSVAPTDVTIDDASVKLMTLNASQTYGPEGVIQFQFVVPVSPVAGEIVAIRYRVVDATNYWMAYIQRNAANTAWDFRLDSISSGVATNRINVTGVGSPTLLKVVTGGNTHECYTGTGTLDAPAYTQRGSAITSSTHNSGSSAYTIYSSTVTPTKMRLG